MEFAGWVKWMHASGVTPMRWLPVRFKRDGNLIRYDYHLAIIARLSAPITAADLMAHGMGYADGDKQAYAEAFNAIISERAKEQG
jgi:hypothetical protein